MMDKGLFAKTVLSLWLALNIAMLPLAFAEDTNDPLIIEKSPTEAAIGIWGKVTPLGSGSIVQYEDTEGPLSGQVKTSLSLEGFGVILSCLFLVSLFGMQFSKRSQITLFILLGLVTFIIFLFLFYLSGIAADKGSVEKTSQEALETSAIKYYVYSCLDKASIEGIQILGRQGGFIHEYQEGSIINWSVPYYNYSDGNQTANVSYQIYNGISGDIEPIDSFIRNDPITSLNNYYPCRQGYNYSFYDPIQGDLCLQSYNSTMEAFGTAGNIIRFGKTGLSSQANKGIIPDLCSENVNLNLYSCTCPSSHKCEYSVQAQLEAYIENRSVECLNFSEFPGYNVTYGIPEVNVTLGTEDIGVFLNLPFTIRRIHGLPESKMSQFHSIYRVRLKDIHVLLFGGNLILPGGTATNVLNGILNDELNLSYDLVQDGQTALNLVGGISIRKVMPDGNQTNTTIVIINDTESNIGGYPFIFQFAIENRRPALDWIEESTYSWNDVDYQIYVNEDETIYINPLAWDPDEDMLIYSYSGWKVNWDDIFDENAATVSQMFSTVGFAQNLWQESFEYLGCLHPRYGMTPQRCASIPTNRSDVGPHNITVTVTDIDGQRDWQTVNILVDDKPMIPPLSGNDYSDIPDQRASLEDHFFIDITSTLDIVGNSPLMYAYNDIYFPASIDPSMQAFDVANGYLTFPHEGPSAWDIVRMNDPADPHAFSDLGMHDILAKAKRDTGPIGMRTFNINVTECLPHRTTITNVAPYPWNEPVSNIMNENPYDFDLDPFQANHTCCLDDYTRATDNRICFNLTDYGPYYIQNIPSLTDGTREHVTPSTFDHSTSGPMVAADYNMIYKREYRVTCDGASGNTCIPNGANEDNVVSYVGSCATGGKHPQCVYAGYGSSPACQNTPIFSGWNDVTQRLQGNQICNSTVVCSTNTNRQSLSLPGVPPAVGFECLGPTNCFACQQICGGGGFCDFGLNCAPCPVGCGDTGGGIMGCKI